jgi:hypothetical protein
MYVGLGTGPVEEDAGVADGVAERFGSLADFQCDAWSDGVKSLQRGGGRVRQDLNRDIVHEKANYHARQESV